MTVARTMKALGIVQRIQAETDPGEWEKHWAAANHSRRPANKRLLYPFQVHCREWPSAETWETVAAVGRTFTVQRP